VANTRKLFRQGAVGFIDWLDESTHFLPTTAPIDRDEQSCSGSGKKVEKQVRNAEPVNRSTGILPRKLIRERSGIPRAEHYPADASGNAQDEREHNAATTKQTEYRAKRDAR
jgi:hypothetical protein